MQQLTDVAGMQWRRGFSHQGVNGKKKKLMRSAPARHGERDLELLHQLHSAEGSDLQRQMHKQEPEPTAGVRQR